MDEVKKVKAEVVGRKTRWDKFKIIVLKVILKLKLAIAILLDLVDLVLANIPILNTLWDIVTIAVLLIILKNKWLAFGAMAELPLVGLPFLGQIDALIPMATILTLLDSAETKFHIMDKFE